MWRGVQFFIICLLHGSLFASHIYWDVSSLGFKKISDSPEVYECEHFLTDAECDHIIAKAKPQLVRSTVVDLQSSKSKLDHRRTSLGTFLTSYGDPIIQRLRRQSESLTKIPEANGESLQVLHYGIGGEYQPHYDYFDPSTVGGLSHFDRGGQRVATILFYLNDVTTGGETVFPKAGIKIKPTKGKAVLFFNVAPTGAVDPQSFHGGAPVIAGEKWIATLWLRERTFH